MEIGVSLVKISFKGGDRDASGTGQLSASAGTWRWYWLERHLRRALGSRTAIKTIHNP